MASDQVRSRRHQVFADLVAGLLDARDDPATDRFDAELDAALANGTVTAETAHRLRFWQRAAVRTLADHMRAVLPPALGALDAARDDARHEVEDMTSTLGPDPQLDTGDRLVEDSDQPEPATTPVRAVADGPRGWGDTPGPTSSTPGTGASSLEQRRNRLIVADLVPAVPDVRTDRR